MPWLPTTTTEPSRECMYSTTMERNAFLTCAKIEPLQKSLRIQATFKERRETGTVTENPTFPFHGNS